MQATIYKFLDVDKQKHVFYGLPVVEFQNMTDKMMS